MADEKERSGTLDLDKYREKREKEGTWPIPPDEHREYWRRQKNDDKRSSRLRRAMTELLWGSGMTAEDMRAEDAYYRGSYDGPRPEPLGDGTASGSLDE